MNVCLWCQSRPGETLTCNTPFFEEGCYCGEQLFRPTFSTYICNKCYPTLRLRSQHDRCVIYRIPNSNHPEIDYVACDLLARLRAEQKEQQERRERLELSRSIFRRIQDGTWDTPCGLCKGPRREAIHAYTYSSEYHTEFISVCYWCCSHIRWKQQKLRPCANSLCVAYASSFDTIAARISCFENESDTERD